MDRTKKKWDAIPDLQDEVFHSEIAYKSQFGWHYKLDGKWFTIEDGVKYLVSKGIPFQAALKYLRILKEAKEI